MPAICERMPVVRVRMPTKQFSASHIHMLYSRRARTHRAQSPAILAVSPALLAVAPLRLLQLLLQLLHLRLQRGVRTRSGQSPALVGVAVNKLAAAKLRSHVDLKPLLVDWACSMRERVALLKELLSFVECLLKVMVYTKKERKKYDRKSCTIKY